MCINHGLSAAGACGAVVVDDSKCMYTNINEGQGQPFDRYIGMLSYEFLRF